MPRQRKQRLKKRKDGYYACRYKNQWFYSKISSEDAIAQRDEFKELEKEKREALFIGIKLKDYAEKWLKNENVGAGISTVRNNKIQMKKLTDKLGSRLISEIKPSDIKALYTDEFEGKSDDYIRHTASLYRRFFDAAVDDGYIESNPARQKSAKPHKGTVNSHRAITPEERYLIENFCKDHRAHAAVMTMLYAGLRPQEVKAFDIDKSVDFEKNEIKVIDFIHMSDNTHYEITGKGKTKNAVRIIPLLEPLRKTLEGKHGLVISKANGEQITAGAWRAVYRSYVYNIERVMNGMSSHMYSFSKEHKKILAEGGTLPEWKKFTVVPYDLRHSFCTMCRDYGVELKTCVLWMGHSDASMILKIYDEAPDSRLKSEAEKLNQKLIQSMDGSIANQTGSKTVDK